MRDIQFQQLNNQLELIALTLAGHDVKFESFDDKFNRIEQRLEQMSSVLISHDRRLGMIEDNYVTKKEFRELINTIDYSVKEVMNMSEWCSFAKAMEHTP